MVDELAAYLATAGIGAVDRVIHKEVIPETPDVVVCLFQTAGPASTLHFGQDGVQYEWPGLAVRVRGRRGYPEEGLALAYRVQHELLKIQGEAVGGTPYNMIHPGPPPTKLNVDTSDRTVYVVNLVVEKEPS